MIFEILRAGRNIGWTVNDGAFVLTIENVLANGFGLWQFLKEQGKKNPSKWLEVRSRDCPLWKAWLLPYSWARVVQISVHVNVGHSPKVEIVFFIHSETTLIDLDKFVVPLTCFFTTRNPRKFRAYSFHATNFSCFSITYGWRMGWLTQQIYWIFSKFNFGFFPIHPL